MTESKDLELVFQLYDAVFLFDCRTNTYTTYKVNFDSEGLLPKSGNITLLKDCFESIFVQYDDVAFLAEHIEANNNGGFEVRLYIRGDYRWFRIETVFDAERETKLVLFKDVHEEKCKELQMIETIKTEMNVSEVASKTKNVFLAKMSHDMRTPMNGIIGMVEIAKRNLDDKEQVANCLAKIDVSGKLLLSLINDILDFSRIEHGTETIAKETFDIRELISDVFVMFQQQIDRRKIKLITDYSQLDNPIVETDMFKLKKIIMNVFSNAVKFTRDTVKVTLSDVFSVYNNYLHYSVIISDNGIGMSKEFLKRLYRPFEREEREPLGQVEGTGMGMAITKNLVSLLDGNIYVESVENVGTTFTLSFDFANKQTKDEVLEAEVKSYDFSGKALLIVEDNEINAEILKVYLEWSGAKIELACNGVEAVKMFGQKNYDMILMDIQMPLMNGYEATEHIRHSQKADALLVPIVAMTANAFAEDMEHAKQVGMNDYLTKPIDMNVLQKTLAKYLLMK